MRNKRQAPEEPRRPGVPQEPAKPDRLTEEAPPARKGTETDPPNTNPPAEETTQYLKPKKNSGQ